MQGPWWRLTGPFSADVDEWSCFLEGHWVLMSDWVPGLVSGLESCLECSVGHFEKNAGPGARTSGLIFVPLHHSQMDMHSLYSAVWASGHRRVCVGSCLKVPSSLWRSVLARIDFCYISLNFCCHFPSLVLILT